MGSRLFKTFIVIILISFVVSCSNENIENTAAKTQLNLLEDSLVGQAIAYSGYRNGQHPDSSIYPTYAQVLEDLKIIEKNWNLIRTYGADKHAEDVLEVIDKEKINIKVMLGIWLYAEPERNSENRIQIKKGIELADKYENIVVAVNVGNESQIHWSDHKVPAELMVAYLKEVKSKVSVPVTTADSWDYWTDLEKSSDVVEAVDFIAAHIYPLWGNVDIDRAMEVTIENYNSLKSAIPNKKIIITEAGWATYTEGDAHVPKAGDEVKQLKYFNDLMNWSKENKVTVFWFEAFDEPWKGTGTEGFWGLFTEGRKAKLAMYKLYPDLITDEPTSPSYD